MHTIFPTKKLTIQKFYLPNGKSTQNKGVISDIALPSINEFLPIGEADLDHAMPWDEIKPVNWNRKGNERALQFDPIDESLKNHLSSLSNARQNELEEFAFLNESIEFFKEKRKIKSYSLNLEKRKQQKEKDKAFRDELEARQEELEKTSYTSIEITLNIVAKGTPMEDLMGKDSQASPENPNGGEDEEDEDDGPSLDIHLQESLRILSDWIQTRDVGIVNMVSVVSPKSEFAKLTDPAIVARPENGPSDPNP